MKSNSANSNDNLKLPRPKKILSPGVAGISDPKWIFVAVCYIAAIAFMGQDPWYGDKLFTYNQGLFVGILAILIVSGFCWESYLLGRPHGINLILHFLLMVPVALLIGRIAGLPADPETSYGFLGQFKEYMYSLTDTVGLSDIIPYWIQDVFRNPGILILILFASIAFTQQKASRRFALTVVAFLIPAMQTLSHDPRPTLAFGIGFLAMLAGIGAQYSKYGDQVGQQNILSRLHSVDDRTEYKCSLRLAKQAVEEGYVTEDGVVAVIQREYSKQFELEPITIRAIAQAISHRLVREHRILQLHGDERGFFLIPYPAINKIDSIFDEIAMWIRKILLTGIVIIWLISPIDFFPDSIPILGAIDDAVITLVGAGQWIDTFRQRRDPVPKVL
jgi:hypothetical protein